MAFLNLEKPRRIVPGFGSPTAKIAIVGEAPGSYEDMQLKPFVGPAGTVLEQCLHAAGLIRSEVYMTNTVKVKPPGNDIAPYYSTTRGTFTAAGMEWVGLLREELNAHQCNVIVACGATAAAACAGVSRITKYRGYVFPSIELDRERIVIPTIHPAAAMRGMYIYRHLIAADLKKAKALSNEKNLVRPERQLVTEFGSVEEVLEWLEYYKSRPIVSVDIEVLNYELSCIALSSDPKIAVSIPIAHGWTEMEEIQIFRGLQSVLSSPSVKVFQNGVFDIHFLLTRCGLTVSGPIEDTMIGHHIMYPELQKGLAFLGSIYCGTQAYWKDSVKFNDIKEES